MFIYPYKMLKDFKKYDIDLKKRERIKSSFNVHGDIKEIQLIY